MTARTSALSAALGAAAALLALSTLGLTWVRRDASGPLGEASAAQVEALSGRDVAPLVAALVPGTAAVVVVALLLRGWWRAGALTVAAVAGVVAAGSAVAVLLPGGAGEQGEVTLVPAVAALACLVTAGGALLGVLAAVAARRAGTDRVPTADPPGRSQAAADVGVDEPADLWRALDAGQDPT